MDIARVDEFRKVTIAFLKALLKPAARQAGRLLRLKAETVLGGGKHPLRSLQRRGYFASASARSLV